MLWIRDILVQIRICGSVTLTYGFGSCSFRQWLSKWQQKDELEKYEFFSKFFKDKKTQRIHKTGKIKIFLTFFLLNYWRIQTRINTVMTDSGGPKIYRSYGSGSTTLISKLTSRKAGELVVVDLLVFLVLGDEGGRLPLLALDLHVHQLPL